MLGAVSNSESQPTAASYMVYEDLAPKVNVQLRALSAVMSQDVVNFNQLVHDANAPPVVVPEKK